MRIGAWSLFSVFCVHVGVCSIKCAMLHGLVIVCVLPVYVGVWLVKCAWLHGLFFSLSMFGLCVCWRLFG